MIELIFLEELMLIRLKPQKSILFVTFANFNQKICFQPAVCNGRHDVLMMSIDLKSITILNIMVLIIVV